MKKQNGFTLVELLAVIVILGILLTFVSVNVIKNIKSSKEDVGEFTLSQIEDAAKTYALDHDCSGNKCEFSEESKILSELSPYYPEMKEKCEFKSGAKVTIKEDDKDITVTTTNDKIECKE